MRMAAWLVVAAPALALPIADVLFAPWRHAEKSFRVLECASAQLTDAECLHSEHGRPCARATGLPVVAAYARGALHRRYGPS